MKQIIFGFLLIAISSCTPLTRQAAPKPVNEGVPPKEELVGVWRLVKDDEFPNQEILFEQLVFHKDGQLLVDGVNLLCGRYNIIGDQLQIIAPVNGYEIAYLRKFILNSAGLHLKNMMQGFAHYQKRQGLMKICMPDEKWKLHAIGYVSLKAPQEWTIFGEVPESNGMQELRAVNPDESKRLMVIRLPVGMGYPQNEIIAITKDIAAKFVMGTPLAGMRVSADSRHGYFGITGKTLSSEITKPPMTLKIVIKRLRTSAALIFALSAQDLLMELHHMAKSIYIDGTPVASE